MFSKKSDPDRLADKPRNNKGVVPSVISQDTNILGNIITDGYIDIDGNMEGNVKCTEITLRQNGVITGDIIAETANLYGKVKGLVKAKNVFLYKTCNIEGVVMHESIAIEDGAYVDGQLKRSNKISTETQLPESGAPGGEPPGIEVIDNMQMLENDTPESSGSSSS